MKRKEFLYILITTALFITLLKGIEQYNIISFMAGMVCNWINNSIGD